MLSICRASSDFSLGSRPAREGIRPRLPGIQRYESDVIRVALCDVRLKSKIPILAEDVQLAIRTISLTPLLVDSFCRGIVRKFP
jgi:hypothetical protein